MEISKFKKPINAVSLFANVGLAETYFKEVGVNVVVANELLEERARFYSHLYPSVNMIVGDITDESIFEKIVKESKKKEVEFLIATPPCQGMSCAGKKDPYDPRNFLIYYAIEAVKRIKPKFVLFENVPMQQHTQINLDGKYLFIPEYVEAELSKDYIFNSTRIINSKDYGVPQSRQRYIYLMVRKDIGFKWDFPEKESKIITLREAIGMLPSLDPFIREESERYHFPDFEKKRLEGLKVSKWHYPPTHSWKQVKWLIHTPSGQSAFKNDIYFPSTKGRRIKGAPRTYMRMDWDKPATTVLQNNGVISTFSTVHPGRVIYDNGKESDRIYSDARVLTIYELLIVSSLPLNWRIPEWANETLIRSVIGEGIPPLLIRKIVEQLVRSGGYDR